MSHLKKIFTIVRIVPDHLEKWDLQVLICLLDTEQWFKHFQFIDINMQDTLIQLCIWNISDSLPTHLLNFIVCKKKSGEGGKASQGCGNLCKVTQVRAESINILVYAKPPGEILVILQNFFLTSERRGACQHSSKLSNAESKTDLSDKHLCMGMVNWLTTLSAKSIWISGQIRPISTL